MNRDEPNAGSAARLPASVVLVLAACSVTAVCAAAPPAAGADLASAPVRIERCAIDDRPVLLDPFNGTRVNLVARVALRLVNEGTVIATAVTLDLRYGGLTKTVTERGSFGAGETVDRAAAAFSGSVYEQPSAECRVTAVNFADGTFWKAP